MSVVASDCDCIVLAAGFSSRSSGHKLLKPIAGRPLVRVAVEHALAACRRVILVVGHEADAVIRAALPLDVATDGRGADADLARAGLTDRIQIVHNELFASGMFSSIQAGMRAVESEWFFVVPADLPGISPAIYAAVADAVGAAPEGAASTPGVSAPTAGTGGDTPGVAATPDAALSAIVPFCRGVRGHPVLLHRSLIAPTIAEPADAGPMRALLSRYRVHRVDLDDHPAIVVDLDTDEAYAEYQRDR